MKDECRRLAAWLLSLKADASGAGGGGERDLTSGSNWSNMSGLHRVHAVVHVVDTLAAVPAMLPPIVVQTDVAVPQPYTLHPKPQNPEPYTLTPTP